MWSTYQVEMAVLNWWLRHQWVPVRVIVPLALRARRAWGWAQWRWRRLAYLWGRFRLLATLWPLAVRYHGHCCDTGPYTWFREFRWGRPYGWRWPGLQAWQATTWRELEGISDGPTAYSRTSLRAARGWEETRCDSCGAGNAPYALDGYNFCLQCYDHERRQEVW